MMQPRRQDNDDGSVAWVAVLNRTHGPRILRQELRIALPVALTTIITLPAHAVVVVLGQVWFDSDVQTIVAWHPEQPNDTPPLSSSLTVLGLQKQRIRY